MKPGKAIVIGGGVVGASCAYELALRGWTVELLEKGTVGGGCSHGNCGYVCPSHVYPLAKPGAIASTLPLLFRRNSPFMIRPRVDVHLWGWLARFAASCTAAKAEDTSVALHALLINGKIRYEEIVAAERIDCGYERKGCLFVYADRAHLDAFGPTNEAIVRRFGYGGRLVRGDELAAMEPTLRDGLAGAWYFECDAHLRPDRYMSGLHAALVRRGVVIREGCEAKDLTGLGGRAVRAVTNHGEHGADAFVVATGAWTPKLSHMLGVKLPIVPGKGYSVTARRPARCPAYPMVFEEARVAITPFADGYRLGSMMEFAGYDDSMRPERIALLKDSAAKYLRAPEPLDDEQPWFGWRPMVPDGKPFVDFSPRFGNVMVAAGHSMIGMSTGPGTGRLVAEMLSDDKPHLDPAWFRIGR
ncbi:MAG: amino acid dehydrogenase [Phycisphaerae bacterium]|nr:MAG: amino acid dehydrogenase [Phycisphaerae bacterium]